MVGVNGNKISLVGNKISLTKVYVGCRAKCIVSCAAANLKHEFSFSE